MTLAGLKYALQTFGLLCFNSSARFIFISCKNVDQRQKPLILFFLKKICHCCERLCGSFILISLSHCGQWIKKKNLLSCSVWDKYFLSPSFVALRASSLAQIGSCKILCDTQAFAWPRECALLSRGHGQRWARSSFVSTA